MTQSLDEVFERVVQESGADPGVLGLIVGGSRGKGFATRHSDYDCTLVVTDAARESLTFKARELPPGFDVGVHTIRSFTDHAGWNGALRWDRYNWTHLRAHIDKTDGLIQRLIDEKGRVPPGEVDTFVRVSLDHYTNQVYRSIKCLRDGNDVGHRLEAADSILPLLDAVFALHDGRLRPYYKYLRWELTEFPLERLPWSADQFLSMVLSVVTDGSAPIQQAIFQWVYRRSTDDGFGAVFDAWGDDLWFARGEVAGPHD